MRQYVFADGVRKERVGKSQAPKSTDTYILTALEQIGRSPIHKTGLEDGKILPMNYMT